MNPLDLVGPVEGNARVAARSVRKLLEWKPQCCNEYSRRAEVDAKDDLVDGLDDCLFGCGLLPPFGSCGTRTGRCDVDVDVDAAIDPRIDGPRKATSRPGKTTAGMSRALDGRHSSGNLGTLLWGKVGGKILFLDV